MHYFFLDESYRGDPDRREIVVACWGVEQGRLNRRGELLNELFKPPIEEQICSALKGLDALALVASATLEKSLYRSGEIDGTDDIPAMARADNIWSQCIIFSVATLILEHWCSGRPVDTIDVYFDPKSLKGEHEEALEKTLRELVVSEAKRYDAQFGGNRLKKLKIRNIQPVEKPKGGQAPNRFQIGTWVAHTLCARAREITALAGGRVKTYDMSDTIRRTVQQWDGKSFYDS